MAIKGFLLLQTEVGKLKSVSEELNVLDSPNGAIEAVHTVTGPYDAIVRYETADLNTLSNLVEEVLALDGVKEHLTCHEVHF